MKTIAAFTLLLALFCFASLPLLAAGGEQAKKCQTVSLIPETGSATFQTNIFQNANGRVTVVMMQPEKTDIIITFTDSENNTLFREKINEDSARQNFDVSHLDSGNYVVTINRGGACFVKNITVK